MEAVEFGEVVDLDVVFDVLRQPATCQSSVLKPRGRTYCLKPAGLYPLYSPLSKSFKL